MIKHRRVFTAFNGVEYPTAEEAKQAFRNAVADYARLNITLTATGLDGASLVVASTDDDARHYVILQTANYDVLHELPSQSTAIVQACGHITGYL